MPAKAGICLAESRGLPNKTFSPVAQLTYTLQENTRETYDDQPRHVSVPRRFSRRRPRTARPPGSQYPGDGARRPHLGDAANAVPGGPHAERLQPRDGLPRHRRPDARDGEHPRRPAPGPAPEQHPNRQCPAGLPGRPERPGGLGRPVGDGHRRSGQGHPCPRRPAGCAADRPRRGGRTGRRGAACRAPFSCRALFRGFRPRRTPAGCGGCRPRGRAARVPDHRHPGPRLPDEIRPCLDGPIGSGAARHRAGLRPLRGRA